MDNRAGTKRERKMTETVEYLGKDLNLNPIGDLSLGIVAEELALGRAVTVILEPGDATRYVLTLVPMVSPLVHEGWWNLDDPSRYLLVCRQGGACYPLSDRSVPGYIYEHLELNNHHTSNVYYAFLQNLWPLIYEYRKTLHVHSLRT